MAVCELESPRTECHLNPTTTKNSDRWPWQAYPDLGLLLLGQLLRLLRWRGLRSGPEDLQLHTVHGRISKQLGNSVSKLSGLGPILGADNYENPFICIHIDYIHIYIYTYIYAPPPTHLFGPHVEIMKFLFGFGLSKNPRFSQEFIQTGILWKITHPRIMDFRIISETSYKKFMSSQCLSKT